MGELERFAGRLSRRKMLQGFGVAGAAAVGGPALVSVYGGDATTNGTLKLDPKTQTVTQRTMGVFVDKDGKVTPRALFDLKGADFKLVTK